MLRRALVSLLSLEGDIEVVAELSNGSEVVARALECRPDVAVLDIDLPGTDGISVASALYTTLPECRTLILTGLGQPGHLRRAVAAHAQGFLPKDAEPERLTAAIRAIARGERAFDATLALERRELTSRTLAESTLRHPASTLRTLVLIYGHAVGLWLRRVPLVAHPGRG